MSDLTQESIMQSITTICPNCGGTIRGVFGTSCPYCPFTIDPLAGRGTTDYQKAKWNEHTDILQGRGIQLHGRGSYNASFDYNGFAKYELAVYALIAHLFHHSILVCCTCSN